MDTWYRGFLKKNTNMDFMYNQKSCNSEISLFTFKQITRLSDFHLNSWKAPGVGGGYFGFISNRERHRSVSHAVSVHVS